MQRQQSRIQTHKSNPFYCSELRVQTAARHTYVCAYSACVRLVCARHLGGRRQRTSSACHRKPAARHSKKKTERSDGKVSQFQYCKHCVPQPTRITCVRVVCSVCVCTCVRVRVLMCAILAWQMAHTQHTTTTSTSSDRIAKRIDAMRADGHQ